MDAARECVLCGKQYDPGMSLGGLSCRVHPCRKNFNRTPGNRFPENHYECCGATTDPSDLVHYEKLDIGEAPGCVRVDHVSSYGELAGLFSRPFVVVTAESFQKLNIFNEKARYQKDPTEEQYAIPVLTDDLLDDCLYRFRHFASDTPLLIDPKEEHEKLLRIVDKVLGYPDCRWTTEGSKNHEDEENRSFLYDEEYRDGEFAPYEQNEDRFEPFYIVRRLDFVLNMRTYGDTRCTMWGR